MQPGLFHLFRIKSHTDGILRADGQSIDIAGSQFFIQLTGISTTDVEVGWLTNVNPASASEGIEGFFGGIVEEMVSLPVLLSGQTFYELQVQGSLHRAYGVCIGSSVI